MKINRFRSGNVLFERGGDVVSITASRKDGQRVIAMDWKTLERAVAILGKATAEPKQEAK